MYYPEKQFLHYSTKLLLTVDEYRQYTLLQIWQNDIKKSKGRYPLADDMRDSFDEQSSNSAISVIIKNKALPKKLYSKSP